jgi:hypothetical protein
VAGSASDTINALVIGLKQHSYVTTSDNRVFGCFGRSANGNLVRSGQGSSDHADCIANFQIGGPSGWRGKLIGTSGIVYGLTGVCHQAANRILRVAGIMLPAKGYPLIKRSVQTYGLIGREYGWLSVETNWRYRWNQCLPNVAAPRTSTGADVDRGGSDNNVWKSQMANPNSKEEEDQLLMELEFLIDAGLDGTKVDAGTLQQLLFVQQQLRGKQSELAELFRDEQITEAEYVDRLKRALRTADREGEGILGYEDYHRVFGERETIDALIDPKVFLSQPRWLLR